MTMYPGGLLMLTVLPDPEQAEEAVETFNAFTEVIKSLDLTRVLAILILLAACIVVMKALLHILDRTFQRLDVEKSLHTFVRAALRIILWLITLCVVLGYMGIEMTSLIAVLSVVGLALSLAIQGTLSNLAGGIQLLVSKPFKADDYIDAGSVSGTVVEVGLVYTKLRTIDNKIISVPNGTISGQTIVNYNTLPQRRMDLKFDVSYDDPPEKVISCIRSVITSHPMALADPEPFVRLSAYKDSSIEYTLRVWCATADYWDLHFDLLEQIGAAFAQEGIEITYNHLNVHVSSDR